MVHKKVKLLVFEFLAGGGVADLHPLNETLADFLRQGKSMLEPLSADLLQLGYDVVVPVDPKASVQLAEDIETVVVTSESRIHQVLRRYAAEVDGIIIVAPESDGCLEEILLMLGPWSDKLMSPDQEFVRLTGNKWNCHEYMQICKVPCPQTWKIETQEQLVSIDQRLHQKLVIKPVDGAGSEGVSVVENLDGVSARVNPFLIQEFVPGEAVSVLAVSDGSQVTLLEPGKQVFDTKPVGVHIRTEFPLPEPIRARAIALAQQVVEALPKTRGYFGMDLVIGEHPGDDFLIEVNPRLTTSYGFLRKWNREILDQANREIALSHNQN